MLEAIAYNAELISQIIVDLSFSVLLPILVAALVYFIRSFFIAVENEDNENSNERQLEEHER